MNPVTQGLAVHPGQARGACSIHPFQSVGDRDQPGADATIALPSRLPAQLLRTNVITDRHGTHCGLPHPHHNICYLRPVSDATLLASQPQLRWVSVMSSPSFASLPPQVGTRKAALVHSTLMRARRNSREPRTALSIP